MSSLAAIILSMTMPLYAEGDVVKVNQGKFFGCEGKITEVYQPPGMNRYDVGLTKCPNRWLKGTVLYEDVTEDYLTKFNK